MAVCSLCGKENPGEARFCLSCGAPFGDAARAREERKVVTVLFADLVGFTAHAEQLDPEDVRRLLAPYYMLLRSEIERFGGTVEKFIGDAVMALFGAPVAHEDDPERAVRAALAIRDAIDGEGLEQRLRIGVNTGEVLIALDARPLEGEGMAFGDTVNTAARLQAAAPVNGILVGETTYRATRHAIAYRAAQAVAAKGKAEPVTVWEAQATRARPGVDEARAQSPLVGREHELEQLADALARARAHGPQLLSLIGAPGIGKSRLVAELFQIVERDPDLIAWRHGRSLPYGETLSYWALAEIIKAQAGVLESDSIETATAKLHDAVVSTLTDSSEAEWVESHLRPLIGLATEASAASDRRNEAHAAWRRFLERVAERTPLVLVLEDLHWADEGLLDFVDAFVDGAGGVPILLVCTARPELLERRPGWGSGKRNGTNVSIPVLSFAETARILAALLEQAPLPAEVETLVVRRAEGNPLYAEEYVRMLRDRGFLLRSDGSWRLSELDRLPMPESIQAMIAARLDALSADEKDLVQDASVLGKTFWSGALEAIGERDGFLVVERLEELERRELVQLEPGSAVGGQTQYSFLHELVRDVAYGQIPRATRSKKHTRAAAWIETLTPDRTEDRAEMLAHHYLEALDLAVAAGVDADSLREPALAAARDASERALSLSSFAPALRFAEKALELTAPGDPERPALLLRAARARIWLGEADPASLEQARDLALARGRQELAAEASVTLAELFWFRGEQEVAVGHGAAAVALVEDLPSSATKARVLSSQARVLVLNGRNEEAAELGRAALPMAERFELGDVVAYTLNTLGLARIFTGDAGGFRDLERSLELALVLNLGDQILYGYTNLASCYVRIGRLAAATDQLALARASATRFGLTEGLRFLDGEDVFFLEARGEWAEAERRATAFLAEGGSHYQAGPCYGIRSRIRLARGDIEGALDDSARSLDLAQAGKDPQLLLPALVYRVGPLVASGRRGEAEELVERLLRSGMLAEVWLRGLPQLAVDLGRAGDYLEAAQLGTEHTPWLEAGIETARGGHEKAAAIYGSVGAVPDEAEARLRAAEALVDAGRDEEAKAEAARALAFYRRVGANAYVQRAEALLVAPA